MGGEGVKEGCSQAGERHKTDACRRGAPRIEAALQHAPDLLLGLCPFLAASLSGARASGCM